MCSAVNISGGADISTSGSSRREATSSSMAPQAEFELPVGASAAGIGRIGMVLHRKTLEPNVRILYRALLEDTAGCDDRLRRALHVAAGIYIQIAAFAMIARAIALAENDPLEYHRIDPRSPQCAAYTRNQLHAPVMTGCDTAACQSPRELDLAQAGIRLQALR